MALNVTHTYVTLEVSAAAYDEVKSKLLAADYGHTINKEGEIDMHGIALIRAEAPKHGPGERI